MASKLSRDLSNIAIQLSSGFTRGARPRKLNDDEMEALQRRHESLRHQMIEARKQRISARVNAHTTEQSDRVIAASANHSNGLVEAITAALTAAKSEIIGAQQPKPAAWDNGSMEDLKECIRMELKRTSEGAGRNASAKRVGGKLVGALVVAAQQPDSEMGDSIFEISHVESQTWADGAKHTVCILKAEGKPSLSREFNRLSLFDPFVARETGQSVRVVVTSHDVKYAQYHHGWRGVVQPAIATARNRNVKVNFGYLKEGVVAQMSVSVPRKHLKILAADDISMNPNRHPWLARRVRTQTGQVGEIVHVDRGRVKLVLDGAAKRVLFIASKGFSFEALFNEEPEAEAQVLHDTGGTQQTAVKRRRRVVD